MSALDVIADAIDVACCTGCPRSGRQRAARHILVMLRAEGWVIVPREPTQAMKDALQGWAVCAGYIEEGWRAACDAATPHRRPDGR